MTPCAGFCRRGAPAVCDDVALPTPPAEALPLPACTSGFMIRADEALLLSAAVEADAVLMIDCCPGSLLVAGTPVGAAWPRAADSFDSRTREQLTRQVTKAIRTRFERTAAQDVSYGVRQITDVAIKALSPGINDPTTAVHALGHSAALLCELAGRRLGPRLLHDEQGRGRVVLHQPDLGDLLEMALAQPRRYGAADPAVLARLFALLRDLAWCAAPDQRPAIIGQLARLRATAAEKDFDAAELAPLAALAEQVEHALAGRWIPAARPC
ncbi:DUF2254 family protein [Nonomuraea angiospora]|uniref:DUF2254 family protein n=1 Tax=Nonomuraea angiospora TaxID=46172 RepID=UPI0033221131